MAQKRIHLLIRGRVQGVYFRAAAMREARRLGITGWVRNRPDGTVEVVAEGEEDAIKALSSWANHGPSAARAIMGRHSTTKRRRSGVSPKK